MSENFFLQQKFQSLAVALQRSVLQHMYESAYGSTEGLSFELIEGARKFVLESTTGKQKAFGKKTVLRNGYGRIFYSETNVTDAASSAEKRELLIPGRTEWGNYTVVTVIQKYTSSLSGFFMAYDGYEDQKLFIRNWKTGDFFVPLGMKGKKKLQDFFSDLKVPQNERRKLPLIVDHNDHVLAVYNLRIHDRVKATASTKRVVTMSFLTEQKFEQ